MQGASFTSARVEVTRDQIARAPIRSIRRNAVGDGFRLAMRRVKRITPATYIIAGVRSGWESSSVRADSD
jgi:hypothetical protein